MTTRVLIVDDQPSFRAYLRQLLTAAGLQVVGEANDIPEAGWQVLAHQPDLAVVDVMLPGMKGFEGTPRLKALHPLLRVILISAYCDEIETLNDAAAQVGAEMFVSKDDLELNLVKRW